MEWAWGATASRRCGCMRTRREAGASAHCHCRRHRGGDVDAFYRAALAAGGADNGAAGLRPDYHENYYGAFVIAPDGHNLEAVCHKPAPA